MSDAAEIGSATEPAPEVRRGESHWQRLPNGVECFWRDGRDRFGWHVAILIVLLVGLSRHAVFLVRSRDFLVLALTAASLMIWGYLTVLCIRAVKRGIKGDTARLRATVHEGLRIWPAASEQPRVALGRDQISDITVEPDPWAWYCRSWRLVVVVNNGIHRRRRLFRSADRRRLIRICTAIRLGLDAPPHASDSAQLVG